MPEQTTPQRHYRYWGDRKPVALARPVDTVQMAAAGARKTAAIRLYGPIDSWGAPFGVAASEIAAALDAAGENTAIELHVHSPGGDGFEGLAIMNLLRQHKGGVDVVVDGLAASAASIVAMGAATVTMVPGSQMMIHDASALAIGQADDLRQAAEMLESISSNAADQYAAKSGASSDEMRAAMKATTWYKAQEAVDAKLADAVLAPDDAQAAAAQASAASLAFDLSMFTHTPAERAPETPAEPPVILSTEPEEADTMSDTLIQGLRERLGVAEDADESTCLAALDEALAEQADAPTNDPAPAPSTAPTAPEGFTLMRDDALAELRTAARAGAEARAVQLRQERDDTIQAAVNDGRISPARADHWRGAWDADAEGTRAALASLEQIYPTSAAPGYASDDADVEHAVFTDDEADALAELAGLPKGALA